MRPHPLRDPLRDGLIGGQGEDRRPRPGNVHRQGAFGEHPFLQLVVTRNEPLAVRLRHHIVHRPADQRHVAQGEPGHQPADIAPLRHGIVQGYLAGKHFARLLGADHDVGMHHSVEKALGDGQTHDVQRFVPPDQHHAAQHGRAHVVGMGRTADERLAHHRKFHEPLP